MQTKKKYAVYKKKFANIFAFLYKMWYNISVTKNGSIK